jgi:hypothetical protein
MPCSDDCHLDPDAVYVPVEDGGHLTLLDLCDFADREHDEAVHIGLAS